MKFTFNRRSIDVPIAMSGIVFILFISISNAAGTLPQLFIYVLALICLCCNRLVYIPAKIAWLFLLGFVVINLSLLTNEYNYGYSISFVRPFIEGILAANVLYSIFGINDRDRIIKLIKYYIVVQIVFYIIMFVSPFLRTEFLLYIYKGADYDMPAFQNALQFRGYGISKHHLFGFPLAIATMATILCFNRKESVIAKFLFLGLCTILVVFNARIGLASIAISLFLLAFTLRYKDLYFISLIILFATVVLVTWSCLSVDSYAESPRILDWLKDGFMQFFENSQHSTTINDLRSMLNFPETTWEVVFGRGYICELSSDCYSDIGFVRIISLAGMVLLAITLYIYWQVCKKISWLDHTCNEELQERNYSNRILSISLFAIFILATIKGDAYFSSDFSRLLITLAILSSLAKRKVYEALSR